MPRVKHADDWSYEDCIEDCFYSSKFCYEKPDGTMVCPFEYRKCAEDCRKQYPS